MTANVSVVIAQREDALTIPNSALRFHPANAGITPTNATALSVAQATNSSSQAGGGGGQGHRGGSGHARGERPITHTVYVLSGDGADAKLQPMQIKTGISDGISTEVLSGLNEGDKVVTGTILTGTASTTTSNPFGGGGFPRR